MGCLTALCQSRRLWAFVMLGEGGKAERSKRSLRYLLWLVGGAAVFSVMSLVAYVAWFASAIIQPMPDLSSERSNAELVHRQLDNNKLNLSGLNEGRWKIACVVAGLGPKSEIERFALKSGVTIKQEELKRLFDFKVSVQLVYVDKKGSLRWFLIEKLRGGLRAQHVACVLPGDPWIDLKELRWPDRKR